MNKTDQLQILSEAVAKCIQCPELANTRTQTVFGEGNPDTKILCIGEGPGQTEDQTGRPFVGKSGELLNNMIQAAGWQREDLYIANIVKCRPPGNRNPTFKEAKNCSGFLTLQVDIIKPKFILCLGKIAAYYLLKPKVPIEQFRIGEYRQKISLAYNAKVICTYHPSYLLRNPSSKKDAWQDLLFLKSLVDTLQTTAIG